jgi:hypothetical protein
LIELGLVKVGDENFSALLMKTLRYAFAYRAGRTGNEDYLVLKFQIVSPYTVANP